MKPKETETTGAGVKNISKTLQFYYQKGSLYNPIMIMKMHTLCFCPRLHKIWKSKVGTVKSMEKAEEIQIHHWEEVLLV